MDNSTPGMYIFALLGCMVYLPDGKAIIGTLIDRYKMKNPDWLSG